MPGDIFGCPNLVLLASSGSRWEMLLNLLEGTGQTPCVMLCRHQHGAGLLEDLVCSLKYSSGLNRQEVCSFLGHSSMGYCPCPYKALGLVGDDDL